MTTKGRRRFSFETIGSISAIVVAVASLFVAWDEARSVRRQQAASVLPILKITMPLMNGEQERSFRILVQNVGVGPAFVDRARMQLDGEPVASFEELRSRLEADIPDGARFWTAALEGQVLGGGEDLLLFEVAWAEDSLETRQAVTKIATTAWRDLSLPACYCSVYERCWRTAANQLGRPDRVARCERGDAAER